MKSTQKSVRLPDSLWEWIASLPDKYGANLNQKVQSVMYRGKERLEREMELIAEDDADGNFSDETAG